MRHDGENSSAHGAAVSYLRPRPAGPGPGLAGAGRGPSLELAPTELNQSLGALLGLPGFAREPGLRLGGGPTEEMLVMFAFRGDLLNSFLAFFREEGLAPVALKAMVTPINVHWSALRLHEALREEHAQLRAAAKQKERDHT